MVEFIDYNTDTSTKDPKLSKSHDDQTTNQICTQDQRIAYVQSQCRALNVTVAHQPSDLYYVKPNSQFLVDPTHELIYCQSSKVACSTWKGVMISSLLGNKILTLGDGLVHKRPYLESLGIRYIKDWGPAEYATYTRFMVTRHPLDRLMSAYKNMVRPAPRQVGPTFRYNQWINTQLYGDPNTADDEIASFEDFLSLVSSQDPLIQQSFFYNDQHWLPMSQVCQPCSVRYDYIVRLETAEEESGPILRLFHINDTLPHKNNGQRTEDTSGDSLGIGQSILREYVNVSPEIMRNVYERYKLDFELYGYSYDDLKHELRCSVDMEEGGPCC